MLFLVDVFLENKVTVNMVYFIAWTIKCSLHRRKMSPFEMWKKGINLSSFNSTLSCSKHARYLNPTDFYRIDKNGYPPSVGTFI